jgi:hypothetical protein
VEVCSESDPSALETEETEPSVGSSDLTGFSSLSGFWSSTSVSG